MASEARCTSCGANITPGARFCMGCGADVSGEQSRVATSVAPGRPVAKVGSTTQALQRNLLEGLREATLGDYEILVELGRGGMATVFLGHDIALDRKVAIKVMNPQLVAGEGMVERFKLEARTAAALSHPHIIPIYAVRQTDDLLYFVMKFIEGRPLDSIIKQSAPLPIAMVRTIVTKVGEALGYAHRRGVVHRDIKPANIMIDVEGMPIVTDFGIAKVADKQGLTMTGATIGTPTYMSPEQCNAQPISGASDQYSLGVMAYEMLTGRPLYDGDSVMTIMFKHVHDAPPEPEALGSHVPRDLAEAIARMLRKNPAERWPTLEDALPFIAGANLAYDDSVRTQMIQFARAGAQREILDRVSTPRSPIPVGVDPPIESAETVRVATMPQSGARAKTAVKPAPRPAPARPKRSRAGLIAGVVGVLVVGAGAALAVLKPWASGPDGSAAAPATEDPGVTGAAVTAISPPPQQAAPAESSTAVPPPAPTAPVSGSVENAAPTVQSVRITGAPSRIQVGDTASLSAVVTDQNNRPMQQPVRWQSSNPAIAQVNQSGRIQGLAEGRVDVIAQAGGIRHSMSISVLGVPVARVTVRPTVLTLQVGGTDGNLTAVALGANDATLDRSVAWRSSNTAVATVSSTGRVTPIAAGRVVITATSDGISDSAQVQVNAPAAADPAPAPPRDSAPVARNPQVEIAELVRFYAAALEARNLVRVKSLYPGMPQQQEREARTALSAMEDLRVRLTATAVTVDGDQATATVTGQWTFKGGKLDISNRYVFERSGDTWRIVAIH